MTARREKIFNLPPVVTGLLGLFLVVHLIRLALPIEMDVDLVADFAFTPGRFALWLDPAGMFGRLAEISGRSPEDALVGRYLLTHGAPQWLWVTPLSYAFLHGDWTHLIFNSVWCAAFGAPVARRFGAARFLLLGLVGAVLGAALHLALHFYDLAPVIGASAAVSAYMGAATRFVFQPGGGLGGRGANERPELAGLGELLRNRQTLAFIVVWFASNLLVGLGGQPLGLTPAPVAWEAHIGGFAAGLFLASLFDQRR
jgi:membrane associated rhomboid family serine protease